MLLCSPVVSRSWSFVSVVPSQMTYPVVSSSLDSARSYMMQGALLAQGTVSSIPIGGSISPEGFLPSIVLLVVIIVTVLIVAVILVVVVIAIVGVVIVVVFIGIVVVVVGGVSSIFKLLFVIIGVLRRIMFYYLLHQPLSYGWAYAFPQDKASSVKDITEILEYKTSRDRHGDNRMSDPRGGLVYKDQISGGGVVDLTGDEDPTDKDGDIGMGDSTGVSMSLGGEISSGGKKSQESNIGDSHNNGDGDTTVGGAIGA
ncbi:hypothetical protein Tco_1114458 [Tanacetum coccineum]|uniref:Uncharacterized protein n=1 Tax=Tanacetum coccineum TaxID=301880 RepID=A0ABQ5IWN4_9ASTR